MQVQQVDPPSKSAPEACADAACSEATRTTVKRIANAITMLKGDLYGDYVHRMVGGWNMYAPVTKLQCRMDIHTYKDLLNLLHLDYQVTCKVHCRKWLVEPTPDAPAAQTFHPILLSIHVLWKECWRGRPIELDCEMLVRDQYNIYLRSFLSECLPQRFRLEYYMERSQERRFCLYDTRERFKGSHEEAYYAYAKALRKAYEKVQEGWTMDDAMLGDASFVISSWGTLLKQLDAIRTRCRNAGQRKWQLLQNSTCSLCQEAFKPEDRVVNLPCNHTYHYYCQEASTEGGVHAWIVKRGKCTCPMCRHVLIP